MNPDDTLRFMILDLVEVRKSTVEGISRGATWGPV